MQNDAHSPEIEKGPENVKRQETCRRATFSGTMVFRKSITPENVNEIYVSYRITFSDEPSPRACAREPLASVDEAERREQQKQQDARERQVRVMQAMKVFFAGNGRLPRRTTKSGRFGSPKTSRGQAFDRNRCSLPENVDGQRSDNPKPGILRDVQ